MDAIIVDDGRNDVKAAEILLREYMRAHLADIAEPFGVQMSVSDALATDFEALRDPQQQAWGMLVAWAGDAPLGCVVLEAMADDTVELKRLYVRPPQRGAGIGRRLAISAIGAARMAGAAAIRLNTHHGAAPALGLYESLGFVPVAPYPGASIPPDRHGRWVFMELKVESAATAE